MVTPSIRSVVLIPFPFSNLSQAKLRPALLLARVDQGDYILAQITSKNYSGLSAIKLRSEHFSSGNLRVTSFVRPGKLRGTVGQIKPDKFKEIIEVLISMFRKN